MKIYIATKFENTAGFHKMREMLEADGHEITHDWTKESIDKAPPGKLQEYLNECAYADQIGVEHADVLIFIPVKEAMAGAWVEFGIALEMGKIIIVIDNGLKNCIFFNCDDVEMVKTFEEAIESLRDHNRRPLAKAVASCAGLA